MPSTSPRFCVFLVAGDADVLSHAHQLLNASYNVETFTSSADALDAAERVHPDLIITAATGPHVDGAELIRSFRGRSNRQELPIVLLATGDEQANLSAIEAGADSIIRLPVHDDVWTNSVESQLAVARVRRDVLSALQASEARYRAIVEGQAEMVCRFRPDGTILFVNGAYARARGSTPDILYTQKFWDFIDQADRPSVEALLDRITPETPEIRIENRFETADGTRWTLWTNRGLVFGAEGQPTELQSSGIDITERKLAEQALQESEAKLSAILERLPVGVGVVDANGRTLSMNPTGLDIHGFSSLEEMLVGFEEYRDQFAVSYPNGRSMPGDEWPLARAMRGEFVHDFEVLLQRPDGEEKAVSYSAVPVTETIDGERRIVFVMQDVTERKLAERDQAHLASIVASSDDAIVSKNLDGIITFWNHGAERIFGYSAEEAIGQSILLLIPPDLHSEEEVILKKVKAGEKVDHFETIRMRKNGMLLNVSVTISPIRNASGDIIGASKVARDITESKKAEQALRESEERLRELNQTLERRVMERTADLEDRNRELQSFAFIASHDLREPLRKIQAFGDLLHETAGDALGEEGEFFLHRVRSAAARMDGLLVDLLSFSRIATTASTRSHIRLDEVVHDVVRDYELTISETGARIEVEADFVVEGDATQIRQLLTNLVGNALKYRRDDVTPEIRVTAALEPNLRLRDREGPVCRIVVSDNGIGFENKYVDRIFEPFERLHGRAAYEGTGMGLAICRRIVVRHGGSITAESAHGEGSRFIVDLPIRQYSQSLVHGSDTPRD